MLPAVGVKPEALRERMDFSEVDTQLTGAVARRNVGTLVAFLAARARDVACVLSGRHGRRSPVDSGRESRPFRLGGA